MSVAEVITGSYNDDDSITRFYAALARCRPEWHTQAACRGMGPADWFPDRYAQPTRETLALCAACPVVEQCGEAGRSEPAGVWGGLTRSQRERRRRSGQAAA